MLLKHLAVRNFRNLASLDLDIPSGGMIVIGENGQGKTNLLEAIYYLVLFRSLRGARDRELVRFGESGFFVAGETVSGRIQAGYETARKKKKVVIEGEEIKRLGDAVGHILAVPFSPVDREIVSGGPGNRRRYLDVVLSLSDHSYLANLTAYRTAIKQRNAALRSGRPDAVRAFDSQLASAGVAITETRLGWVNQWKSRFSEITEALGENAPTEMEYRPRHDLPDTEERYRAELDRTLDRDLQVGATSAGPHRHDLRLSVGGHSTRGFGSAGQQRTAAAALRLLEAETIGLRLNKRPIGLYDDVFAELDRGRQERFLALIQESLKGQAIVAAPRESEVPRELIDLPRWYMKRGRLEPA